MHERQHISEVIHTRKDKRYTYFISIMTYYFYCLEMLCSVCMLCEKRVLWIYFTTANNNKHEFIITKCSQATKKHPEFFGCNFKMYFCVAMKQFLSAGLLIIHSLIRVYARDPARGRTEDSKREKCYRH